jgi:hypothetical protein
VRWPTLPLSSKPSSLSARRPAAFRNRLYRCARVSSARELKSRFSENQTMDARTVRQLIFLRARPTHSS